MKELNNNKYLIRDDINSSIISYLSFTKKRIKHDLLQTQVLVLQLNFLNY